MNKDQTFSKVVLRKVAELRLHPFLERVALMPEVVTQLRKQKVKKSEHKEAAEDISADWEAFVIDVEKHGVIEPLKVCGDEVADGRHRLTAAQQGKLEVVPCIQVTEHEAHQIMESTVIGRRHFTKGAKAYFAVLMHPEVVKSTKGSGMKERSDSVGTFTRTTLALKYGVSPDLIDQACKLHERFEQSPTMRKQHEKLVWAGFGLGGILAGLAGAGREGQTIRTSDIANGLFRRLNAFGGSICESWAKIENEDDRKMVGEALSNFLQKLPEDLVRLAREELADDSGDEGGRTE